jgi:vacuolar-type H+-ATPase subunit H
MDKEETLKKIKQTESQIRAMREAAERERETALRDARREALELIDRFREQAETRYREIVAAAEGAVAAEREKMIAAAREEAARMGARGKANVDTGVELVLAKFRGAIRA